MLSNVGDDTGRSGSLPVPHLFQGCLTGTFRYLFGTETIQWSDEVYRIHGYSRGDVVPTFALGVSHVVPAQREETSIFWTEISEIGGPRSIYLTLRDATGAIRQVLATGDQLLDDDGEAIGVWGLLIDLTPSIHLDSHRLANEAVAASALKRSVIEQAKGVLIARTGVSATEAYQLINQRSQDTNRKVTDVSQDLLDSVIGVSADGDAVDRARAVRDAL